MYMTTLVETSRKIKFDIRSLVDGVRAEERRSDRHLHLTAYENRPSKLAQSFLDSNLSFRQHEGLMEARGSDQVIKHGDFILMGLPGVYALEEKARLAAAEMFGASFVDFRPTSGLHGMLCTIAASTNPGDVIYSIDPFEGGHSASRHLLIRMGRRPTYFPWSRELQSIDLERFRSMIKSTPPNALFFEQGTPLFPLPISELRSIVGDHVKIVYDASHTLGLIAGGRFQRPLEEGSDILQGNTHKTFPGPQKCVINYRDYEMGLIASESLSKGLVSNQHTHHAIAAYITTLEMYEFGHEYAEKVVENAQTLASRLAELGVELIKRGDEFTQSHQVLIRGEKIDEKCKRLFACGISTNARYAYGERVIRIGVQEVTRRGMGSSEMETIAYLIARALREKEMIDGVRRNVTALNCEFNDVKFSFDEIFGL